ncbi:hypothetical protein diail_1133 [Diaporthe ilicicola]|nr:hypothetical protein diail_1133 [Diaporthe ilicicola]
MTLPNGKDPAFPNALYQEIKAWASEQEAFELANQAPAPLTDIQRGFLESFRARSPLPEIGQVDYVSLLCRYRQANPEGKKITFAEGIHSIRTAEGSPQWTCTVEGLSEALANEPPIKSFPAAGSGFDASGCPPFARKKDAKQYVAFPKNHLPTPRPLPVLQSQPAKRPNEGTDGGLTPAPKRKPKGTTGVVDVNDESLPATQRVQTLCHSMGLKAPKYVLTNADPRANYVFDGYPDFGDDADRFPEDLGHITCVAGRDNAKHQIAELLVEHLLKMHQERLGRYELLSKP